MYSSASLAKVKNNWLMESLRVMVSVELFLNASLYWNHPCFVSTFSVHKQKVSTEIRNLLPMSVSVESLDMGFPGDRSVRAEAISNCKDKKWSSFLCLLVLSSVVNRSII